jgi:hypothetical protein
LAETQLTATTPANLESGDDRIRGMCPVAGNEGTACGKQDKYPGELSADCFEAIKRSYFARSFDCLGRPLTLKHQQTGAPQFVVLSRNCPTQQECRIAPVFGLIEHHFAAAFK